MGAFGSTNWRTCKSNAEVDWISPSSKRSASPVKRRRLKTLLSNNCFSGKLVNLHSRRKTRQISREDRRAFRALISSWTRGDLLTLLMEMESAWAVRDLVILADEARPSTSSLAVDLFSALQDGVGTDCFVIHKGIRHPAHSVILCARCRYFATIYNSWSCVSSRTGCGLELPFLDDNVSAAAFKSVLHYIYTGDFDSSCDRQQMQMTLNSLGCGTSLAGDLASYNFDDSADCTLIFTAQCNPSQQGTSRVENRDYRLKCSSAILGARSSYLRSLIARQQKSGGPLEIVINEHLFPRVYAHVVLHAVLTDQLDLTKILGGCQVSASSLNEVQEIASGQRHLAPLRHAIDIYHIAQFLSLPRLSFACECLIVSQLSLETLSSLWNWATHNGGSAYVRRCCIAFLRSEFSRVSSSHVLFELEEELLYECLLSDYVLCAEVEILSAIIRWGEHELVRRMEEREPNVIANTTHSISRKGIRRSDLNDIELRNILSRLLPLLRIDYILPPFHQSLNTAYKRGLLDRSPHINLLGQQYPDSRSPDINPDAHWFDHSVPRRHAAGPRLLLPYVVEAREQLRRLCKSGADVLAGFRSSTVGTIQKKQGAESLKIFAENLAPEIVSENMREEVERRVTTLTYDDVVKRALSCGCPHHRELAVEQIRLRVLRELGLDESCIQVTCKLTSPEFSEIHLPYHYSSQPALVLSNTDDETEDIHSPCSNMSLSYYDNEDDMDCLPDVLRNQTAM